MNLRNGFITKTLTRDNSLVAHDTNGVNHGPSEVAPEKFPEGGDERTLRNAPTDALALALGMPPLDLRVRSKAEIRYYRLLCQTERN